MRFELGGILESQRWSCTIRTWYSIFPSFDFQYKYKTPPTSRPLHDLDLEGYRSRAYDLLGNRTSQGDTSDVDF